MEGGTLSNGGAALRPGDEPPVEQRPERGRLFGARRRGGGGAGRREAEMVLLQRGAPGRAADSGAEPKEPALGYVYGGPLPGEAPTSDTVKEPPLVSCAGRCARGRASPEPSGVEESCRVESGEL